MVERIGQIDFSIIPDGQIVKRVECCRESRAIISGEAFVAGASKRGHDSIASNPSEPLPSGELDEEHFIIRRKGDGKGLIEFCRDGL